MPSGGARLGGYKGRAAGSTASATRSIVGRLTLRVFGVDTMRTRDPGRTFASYPHLPVIMVPEYRVRQAMRELLIAADEAPPRTSRKLSALTGAGRLRPAKMAG